MTHKINGSLAAAPFSSFTQGCPLQLSVFTAFVFIVVFSVFSSSFVLTVGCWAFFNIQHGLYAVRQKKKMFFAGQAKKNSNYLSGKHPAFTETTAGETTVVCSIRQFVRFVFILL